MKSTTIRWLKFNAVGGIGIGVQLAALVILKGVFRMNLLVATVLAVEAAVIHNFFWHDRFTWGDRRIENSLSRFMKFNLTTGLFSILGNLFLMKWLVESLKVRYLAANFTSIAVCSIANFLVSDRAAFAVRSD